MASSGKTNLAKPKIALACQGGGSQTAFTAGALKAMMDMGLGREFDLVSISGTSGGALCAALAWFGFWKNDQPRWRRLIDFWQENTARDWGEQVFNDAIIQYMRLINGGMLPAFQLSPASPIVRSAMFFATLGIRKSFTDFPSLLRNCRIPLVFACRSPDRPISTRLNPALKKLPKQGLSNRDHMVVHLGKSIFLEGI